MIITSLEQFEQWTKETEGPYVLDVETHPKRLLGIAFCPVNGNESIYVPLYKWCQRSQLLVECGFPEAGEVLRQWLCLQQFVGHNFGYDKGWIDKTFEIDSKWIACTRLLWHLSSAPSGPRPYGLKEAMTDVLGWPESNEKELEDNIASYGGSIRKGDHYLADVAILATYACKDAEATAALYRKLSEFFDKHNYWHMLKKMMDYAILLERNTSLGVLCDRKGLEHAHSLLLRKREAVYKRFSKTLNVPISEMEREWAEHKAANYKTDKTREKYLNDPSKWKRFNPNSDKDKRELFYEHLKQPVLYKTDSGLPSTDFDAINCMQGSWKEAYLKYEKANTLATNFTKGYLSSTEHDGRLHPGFNICGTVSYRLSGFKPYLLNAPFDERSIMKHFKCDPGRVGIHADLSAIEPTITAHYSEDPALLKVFRDGLGDIYLDLALSLFPDDKALQQGYNPNEKITKAIKAHFDKQRKVAKVVQLAVQYTGTGLTVARSLTKAGFPTDRATADGYVRAYWNKFRRVAEFNYRLREVNRKEGMIRNVIGRIIRVPNPEYKDLPNRFIQSSAHDVLVLWVLQIYKLCNEQGIDIQPVLLDCHDSTSNSVPISQAAQLEAIYDCALQDVNKMLDLSVTIKAERKRFTTLAGLKGEECLWI